MKSTITNNQKMINNNSRIAKLLIMYAVRDMKRIDFEFLIERINLM